MVSEPWRRILLESTPPALERLPGGEILTPALDRDHDVSVGLLFGLPILQKMEYAITSPSAGSVGSLAPLIAAGALPASAQSRPAPPAPSTSRMPEIDTGLLGGVVTLLVGGLLILRERRRA